MQHLDPRRDNPNGYIIDVSTDTEMVRLVLQAHLVDDHTGGIFPEQPDLASTHDILDIACGPGVWVLDVAQTYPDKAVIGIDISRKMVQYAQTQAQTRSINNAAFHVMDTLKPLKFPDASFDLVNMRFLVGFMPRESWPDLLQECKRILRPGGRIRATENDMAQTNSVACEQFYDLGTQALFLAGRTFSRTGKNLGFLPILRRLLQNAGFDHVGAMAFAIDMSYGSASYQPLYEDAVVAMKLIQPFLIKMGVATQQEIDLLYQRALKDMENPDYCASWPILTAWGEKPVGV